MTKLSAALRSRGLKSAAQLAKNHAHGERITYMGGCRCDECRAANTAYERERQKARKEGDWNGIVSAAKARRHILHLSEQGVGRSAVSAASDVSRSIISEIRSGSRKRIRARTERSILAVTIDMASDHALIDATPTWRLINALLDEGYTKTELARRLGHKTHALQIGKDQVTARVAATVKRLYERLMSWDDEGQQQAAAQNSERRRTSQRFNRARV